MRFILIVALSMAPVQATLLAQRFTPRVVPPPSASEAERWQAVVGLPVGTRIEIANRAGVVVEGTLRSTDADRVVVERAGGLLEVPRPSVRRVVRLGATTTGKSARRGFLIGAAIGATHGAVSVETNRGAWMLILASAEGAIGAAIGAFHGKQTRERALIYEASTP